MVTVIRGKQGALPGFLYQPQSYDAKVEEGQSLSRTEIKPPFFLLGGP